MAKNSIRDYDATAANNTDVQSTDISEGCAASGINNALREIMADLKDVSAGTVALETPAADSLTVTGDLTVDTNTLHVDAANNRVGISTSSPDTNLDIERSSNDTGGIKVQNTNNSQASAVAQIEISGGDNAYANLLMECNGTDHSLRQDGSGNLKFINGSTERMRILSGGGLTFNGDTAAANALDDYEEGTFTANFDFSTNASGGMTWTNQGGRYIKIGSQVFISAFLSWSANGFTASGGSLRLVGLPFTTSGTNAYRGGFYISYASNPFTGLGTAYAGYFRTEQNSTQATFNFFNNAGTLNMGEVTSHTNINSSGNFMVTGSYTVV